MSEQHHLRNLLKRMSKKLVFASLWHFDWQMRGGVKTAWNNPVEIEKPPADSDT